jgi:hypothetical protein
MGVLFFVEGVDDFHSLYDLAVLKRQIRSELGRKFEDLACVKVRERSHASDSPPQIHQQRKRARLYQRRRSS